MTDFQYIDSVAKFLLGLEPGTTVNISKTKNPQKFTDAVKTIIDLRVVEVEFSNDDTRVKRLEDVDYRNN